MTTQTSNTRTVRAILGGVWLGPLMLLVFLAVPLLVFNTVPIERSKFGFPNEEPWGSAFALWIDVARVAGVVIALWAGHLWFGITTLRARRFAALSVLLPVLARLTDPITMLLGLSAVLLALLRRFDQPTPLWDPLRALVTLMLCYVCMQGMLWLALFGSLPFRLLVAMI
ncbi:MAG: hypothetical protein AAGG07_09430 [Planctomycetota bacterium]